MRAVLCLCVAVVVTLSALSLSGAQPEETHLLLSRTEDSVPFGWRKLDAAQPDTAITFTVALRQRNLDRLETLFWDVSNPDHPSYGRHLSLGQLGELISPPEEAFQRVQTWLSSAGIRRVYRGLDTLKVTASVQQAERLFGTSFHHFHHTAKSLSVIRHLGEVRIPASLKGDVEMIFGLSEFFTDVKYQPQYHRSPRQEAAADPLITPSVLRDFYNVPQDLIPRNSSVTQSIAAFTDYYSDGALRSFESAFHLANSNIHSSGPDCLPNCDQGESDLDVQYVTAMGVNITTYFMNHAAGYWILEWVDQLSSLSDIPLVHSVSYGWPELQQCQIATTNCDNLGYTSVQYVNRVNSEFQKLGVRGVSVLVSDGDDGAPGLGGVTGNCPVDTSRYCPTGGCRYTSTQCGMITISKGSTQCFFPMGLGSDGCAVVLQDNQGVNAALQDFFSANQGSCSATLDEDSRQGYHIYSECSCSSLKSTTTGSYSVAGYEYQASGGPSLNADFPTSSAYVTSMGATQFIPRADGSFNEVGASITTGAIITTGGGFSQVLSQPDYQTQAVNNYLNSGVNLPPSNTFNGKLRGYPDVAFNGHHYSIFISQSGDQCPCQQIAVDGTSCSSPAFAGLVSLLDDFVISNGGSPLGFLNPLLYKMASEQPNTFNDITSGDNKCNRQWCCEWGYEATTGWDPVSGLGSPNFANIQQYLRQMHKF